MTTVEEFARRLREARAGSGLLLDEVATHVGKDPSTVSRWERGTAAQPPSRDVIAILEEVLGYEGLLAAAGYGPTRTTGIDRGVVTQIVREVLDAQQERTADAIAEAVDRAHT